MKKYVCPDCGGNLEYFEEIVNERNRDIDPKSGVLSKEIREDEVRADNSGICCKECKRMYNEIACWTDGEDEEEWSNLSEGIDSINKDLGGE